MDRDRWAEWLAVRRFGGDAETRRRVLAELSAIRDTLLDGARLGLGETLLDVGCGEGLIAFGALERGAGEVVFSDVSSDLLGVCQEAASDLGVLDRCRFLEASADDLHAIGDGSIDVVTTRSVLIYVSRKRDAFCEFARVLRPNGRISLYEPINRFASRDANIWMGYDLSPLDEIGAKLGAVYDVLQPPDTDPMLDFDERDLIQLAQDAGFFPIQLRLEADIKPTEPRAWEGSSTAPGTLTFQLSPRRWNNRSLQLSNDSCRRTFDPRSSKASANGGWQLHTSSRQKQVQPDSGGPGRSWSAGNSRIRPAAPSLRRRRFCTAATPVLIRPR
jgi:arsenite methyltransferase